MMESIMSSLTAIIIIFPFVLFILVFYIGKQITNKKRSARNIAINVTTIALIFSVHFIIISIWAKSLIWAIILFMILSAIIFTFLYWKFANEIVYRKIFSRYWRLNFLFFSFVYLILLLYGLGSRIFEAVKI
ncbi:DUF3397 domain-containing protein [Lederbergia graminis]|uniref:DUF3397 domain-containing protein n=1 Tax=Lederbergia graminis TaxID=735518 RepID=A0ABW0LDB8_9BACI|nr:DUF3397 domain-containing protein [Paenibacillus bovis]HLU23640.1 DUF3397 domain-containing protein [Bacillaceae bacterium]